MPGSMTLTAFQLRYAWRGPHFLEHLNLNLITVDENFHCYFLHSILDALEHLHVDKSETPERQ